MVSRNATASAPCSRSTPNGTGGRPATTKGQVWRRSRCRQVWITVSPVVSTTTALTITTASWGDRISSMKGMATVPSPKLIVPSTMAPKNIAAQAQGQFPAG